MPFRKWSPALCILTVCNYFCGLLVVEELDKLGIGRFSVAFIYSVFCQVSKSAIGGFVLTKLIPQCGQTPHLPFNLVLPFKTILPRLRLA